MVNVAIAGGSSPTLGRSIIRAIQAMKQQHSIIILSRAPPSPPSSSPPPSPPTIYDVPVHYIDYTSATSISNILETHKIHTLISVIKPSPPSSQVPIHETLLSACRRTSSVFRFVLSDWSMPSTSHSQVEMLSYKASLASSCDAENASTDNDNDNGKVSCSTIQVGMFMNYLAQGSPRASSSSRDGDDNDNDHDDQLLAGLDDALLEEFVSLSHRPGESRLLIPVLHDGTPAKISLTHIDDIGRLLAASLELDPKLAGRASLAMVSQTVDFASIHNFLTQKCGMVIPYQVVTREECLEKAKEYGERFEEVVKEKGEFDLPAFLGRMVWQMVGVTCLDTVGIGGDGSHQPTFNRVLEENGVRMKTWDVEEFLTKAWKL